MNRSPRRGPRGSSATTSARGLDRIVVITGATGKLGPVVARRFANDGARLALVARTAASVGALAAELPGGPDRHVGIAADLSTAEGALTAAVQVRMRLGPAGVLLHLVGGYAGGVAVEDADEAEWRFVFERNVWFALHAIRAFLPDVRAAADGRIVTVSTPLAGAPSANIGAYVASKAALEALTLTVARELAGTSATANVILVRTIGDAKPTHTRPEEIADAIAWLASPAAGAVNGQRIPLVGRA